MFPHLRRQPAGPANGHTYLATPEQRERAGGSSFAASCAKGGKATWWCRWSRIRRKSRPPASTQAYESLANGPLEAFRLGLIHGRMSADGKRSGDGTFRRGQTQVLVCTSVVEVGVDVPNATLMAIEAASVSGWPNCTSCADARPRLAPGLLLRVRRADFARIGKAARGLRRFDRRL